MKEIEVKILDIDRKNVEDKIISLGAKKRFDGEMFSIFFDFKDKSLSNAKNMLRLRKEGSRLTVGFKEFVMSDEAKVRMEYEVEISNMEMMETIFRSLGLSEWLRLKKHRVTYDLDGVHFMIDKYFDEYAFIPDFLEIESEDLEQLYKHVNLLGFRKEDCKPWNALELAAHYSNQK